MTPLLRLCPDNAYKEQSLSTGKRRMHRALKEPSIFSSLAPPSGYVLKSPLLNQTLRVINFSAVDVPQCLHHGQRVEGKHIASNDTPFLIPKFKENLYLLVCSYFKI